jgi:hypothetical protein
MSYFCPPHNYKYAVCTFVFRDDFLSSVVRSQNETGHERVQRQLLCQRGCGCMHIYPWFQQEKVLRGSQLWFWISPNWIRNFRYGLGSSSLHVFRFCFPVRLFLKII